ncbi:MAG: hypothetical protein P4L99_27025 [Chthoniobacter sp.]|nr:hypothetical protein [Chthoniobacter sp.]
MAKPQIEIDGSATTIWRSLARQRVTGLRTREYYPTPGMHGGVFVPRSLGPSGIVLQATGTQAGYELWTETEKLEVWPKEAVALAEIGALDIGGQRLTTRAGKTIVAEFRRVPLTEEEFRTVQQERLIESNLGRGGGVGAEGVGAPAGASAPFAPCPVCGWQHDAQFTQFIRPGRKAILLAGVLPDIVRAVHREMEKGLPRVSTKDDALLDRCGGYGNPCKAFYDLKQKEAYKALFDTSRRGFIALRR